MKRRRPRGRASIGAIFTGMLFGLVLGVGLALFLSQTGSVDMESKSSLLLPVVGAVVGLVAALFGGRRQTAA
jgi:Ca2+/Na+ antiporter